MRKDIHTRCHTYDEINKIIAQSPFFSGRDISAQNVAAECFELSTQFSDILSASGADHIALATRFESKAHPHIEPGHRFLAIKTSDEGVLIFDPTIRQYYPNYPQKYLLCTPSEFFAYVGNHGGMDATIPASPIDRVISTTAQDAFTQSQIVETPFIPLGNRDETAHYLQGWERDLTVLKPSHSWRGSLYTASHQMSVV